MSIELDIIPTSSQPIYWGEVAQRWRDLLSLADQNQLSTSPQLLEIPTDRIVDQSEQFIVERHYHFNLAIPVSFSLSVFAGLEYTDEQEFLEDYAHDMSSETVGHIARQWKKVGYWYELITYGRRSRSESRLFIALATAIGETCNGYILVNHKNIFSLGIGMYSPDIFKHTQWLPMTQAPSERPSSR